MSFSICAAAEEEINGNSFADLNNFTAQTADGGEFSEKDFAGNEITMINIWSTTCPPCIDEMPELAELQRNLPDNVQLITWCLDGAYATEEMQNILEETGFDGVTLTAGDGDLMVLYRQLQYTPTTVFLDEEGNMVGEAMIGSPQDAQQAYLAAINDALTQIGKPVIS